MECQSSSGRVTEKSQARRSRGLLQAALSNQQHLLIETLCQLGRTNQLPLPRL